MNCKINDLDIWIVSRSLRHKNKPCKDNLQTLIRPKHNFNGEQTGAEYRRKKMCLVLDRMDITSKTLIARL